jgi:hypothetical protein
LILGQNIGEQEPVICGKIRDSLVNLSFTSVLEIIRQGLPVKKEPYARI